MEGGGGDRKWGCWEGTGVRAVDGMTWRRCIDKLTATGAGENVRYRVCDGLRRRYGGCSGVGR